MLATTMPSDSATMIPAMIAVRFRRNLFAIFSPHQDRVKVGANKSRYRQHLSPIYNDLQKSADKSISALAINRLAMRNSKYSTLAIAAVIVASLTAMLPAIPMVQGSGSFSMSATPASATVVAGAQTSYTINLQSSGFDGAVGLTASVPTGETGVTTSLNPSSVALTSGSTGSSTLTVFTSMSTPVGSFQVTVTGKGPGAPTQTTSVTVNVVGGVLGASTVNTSSSYLPFTFAELAASALAVAGILAALTRRRTLPLN